MVNIEGSSDVLLIELVALASLLVGDQLCERAAWPNPENRARVVQQHARFKGLAQAEFSERG